MDNETKRKPGFSGLSNDMMVRGAVAEGSLDLRMKHCGGKIKNSILNLLNLRFGQLINPWGRHTSLLSIFRVLSALTCCGSLRF